MLLVLPKSALAVTNGGWSTLDFAERPTISTSQIESAKAWVSRPAVNPTARTLLSPQNRTAAMHERNTQVEIVTRIRKAGAAPIDVGGRTPSHELVKYTSTRKATM